MNYNNEPHTTRFPIKQTNQREDETEHTTSRAKGEPTSIPLELRSKVEHRTSLDFTCFTQKHTHTLSLIQTYTLGAVARQWPMV